MKELLNLIVRHRIAIVIVALVGLAAGGAYCALKPVEWEATAKAFVATDSATSLTDLNQGSTFAQQLVKSYAAVVTTPYVLNPVIKSLSLSQSAAELSQQIDVSASLDEVVIQISVTDKSPAEARQIADAVTQRLATAAGTLSTQESTSDSPIKITQIQPAILSDSPVAPRPLLVLPLSLVAGLLLGIAFVLLRRALDTKVHAPDQIESETGETMLGALLWDGQAQASPLVIERSKDGAEAEAYRALRTNLQFVAKSNSLRIFNLTSASAAEGKSTAAANLALALAATSVRVLLVDTDLRRPKLDSHFGIVNAVGLTDVVIGEATLAEAVQIWGSSTLSILPTGPVPPNPSEFLGSKAFGEFLESVRNEYDYVLLDAAPLLPVADAAIVGQQVDASIVIAAHGQTRWASLRAAIASLKRVDAHIAGVVITKLPTRGAGAYGYYGQGYGYGYGYSSVNARAGA